MDKKDVKLGAVVQHTGTGNFYTVVSNTANSVMVPSEVILGELARTDRRGRLSAEIVGVNTYIYERSIGGWRLVKPGTGQLPKGIRLESRTKSEYYTVAVRMDDPEKKHCDCKICEYGREISALAERQATTQDRARIENLYERLCHAEEDAAYWSIRVHGGFEKVEKTDFHKKHIKTHEERLSGR